MSGIDMLPGAFVERMRSQLEGEMDEFLACYEEEPESGIRFNKGKLASLMEEFQEGNGTHQDSVGEAARKLPFVNQRIPWTENGFYTEKGARLSKHPWYYAGLYYIQEPSAMLPAETLPIEPGNLVLDLCAAPGGKSTEILSRLKGKGLLVANDVSASRAKALVKNIALWGAPNVCITSETPQRLLDAFGCCFDRILVDAPCSGEGMFRKDTRLIASWLERGPAEYAPLQKEILDCAIRMLKPGGMLLYSTCTFSEKEDEAVIANALTRYPEMVLVQVEMKDGFSPGRTLETADGERKEFEQCVRLYPHRVRGEGHFLALLQKQADLSPVKKNRKQFDIFPQSVEKDGSDDSGQVIDTNISIPEPVRVFLDRIPLNAHAFPEGIGAYRYGQIGEQCLLIPQNRLPRSIRYLRTGVRIGTFQKNRFEPSQELALLLNASEFDLVLNLTSEDTRVMRYLKGETINWDSSEASGWVLVCVDGFGLGWGKMANGRVKNKYYPGWRRQ